MLCLSRARGSDGSWSVNADGKRRVGGGGRLLLLLCVCFTPISSVTVVVCAWTVGSEPQSTLPWGHIDLSAFDYQVFFDRYFDSWTGACDFFLCCGVLITVVYDCTSHLHRVCPSAHLLITGLSEQLLVSCFSSLQLSRNLNLQFNVMFCCAKTKKCKNLILKNSRLNKKHLHFQLQLGFYLFLMNCDRFSGKAGNLPQCRISSLFYIFSHISILSVSACWKFKTVTLL